MTSANQLAPMVIISKGVFTEISAAIKTARESSNYSIQKLANKSGLETLVIESIEKGETNITLSDVLCLLEILKIKFTI